MEVPERIELSSPDYETGILPLNERTMVPPLGNDPRPTGFQPVEQTIYTTTALI